MATRMVVRNLATMPSLPVNSYKDMNNVTFAAAPVALGLETVPNAIGELRVTHNVATTTPVDFVSERVLAEVTISGTVTFNIWFLGSSTTFTGRVRARLYKRTTGGSDLESLICQADASADIVQDLISHVYNFTGTATTTTLAPGERFLLRVSITPVSGSFGTGTVTMRYNEESNTDGNSWVEVAQAVTFTPNVVVYHLRRTNVNGIGNFFDINDVLGSSAYATGIVNTQASGTSIPWTRTAGGTPLEWTTGRVPAPGWRLVTGMIGTASTGQAWASESSLSANCGCRVKWFRRKPDGTELLVYNGPNPIELATGIGSVSFSPGGTLTQPTDFAEDDRLVVRAYIENVGTMAAGFTCTFGYDGNVLGSTGDTYFRLTEGPPRWKAESEPAYRSVPDALSMGGVGN